MSKSARLAVRLEMEALEARDVPAVYTAHNVAELIAELKATNAEGGANTITLVTGKQFKLDAADNSVNGPNGLPVVAAGNQLTIVGNGDTIQRKAAATDFRLFEVAAGAIGRQGLHKLRRLVHLIVRGEFTVVQIRCKRDEASRRETIGHLLDAAVETPPLLDHEHTRT